MDDIYLNILATLESQGELDLAQTDLDILAAHEPHSQRVAVLQSALEERRGHLPEAQAVLERFITTHLDSGVARANLARLQWKSGQRERALATLRFALMTEPNQERSLHLFAALLEEDGGLDLALSNLRLLAQNPGAWQPAWVAAQLASSRAPEQAGELLVLAARQSRMIFPPNVASMMALLRSLPKPHEAAVALRPFCRSEAQAALDLFLAQLSRPASSPGAISVTCLRRSVWRHLSQPQSRSALGLAPIIILKPEGWGVQEVSGRLARGFALLVAETLDALAGASVAVVLETVPQAGVVTRDKPLGGKELARLAGSSCQHLLSSYLSFQPPNEFILDTEIYSHTGEYLGRESCRAAHPGACLQQLAQRLSASLVSAGEAPLPPTPDLEVEDALARESAAALVLCAEGALSPETLSNPGRLLDGLVEYTLKNQGGPAFLTLWAGVEAAGRAGLPGGEAQQAMLTELIAANEGLSYWTGL